MEPTTACPTCGAYSIQRAAQASALLAVCDVLTVKALEKIGSRIVRAQRSRYHQLGDRPMHEAHVLWPADTDEYVTKSLRGAWDVVPAMLTTHFGTDVSPDEVVEMLDSYVHDAAIVGYPHTLPELCYRFVTRLGLAVWIEAPALVREPARV